MYKHTHTKRPKSNQKRSVPSMTKNGELAVFYNLAYNRTSDFIKTMQRKDKAHPFEELRAIFFPKHSETEERKERIEETDLDLKMKGVTDRTYSELKVFLWNSPKGKNIRFVTPQDIKEINHILLLLLRLRDYHSHYWHEDTAIYPTHTARLVLDRTFEIALHSYQPQIDFAVDVTPLTNCWDAKESGKLSVMGINFFLGFFLTKGQMELFMKSRQYLNRGGYSKPPTEMKRSNQKESYLVDARGNMKQRPDGSFRSGNDILDLEKSRFITAFYAQRDASESAAYWLGKHTLFAMDVKQFHLLQMSNYLESVPGYLYTAVSEATQREEVQRTSKRPTALLATSMALLAGKVDTLAWRVHSDEVIQKKVSHKEKVKEDLQKIPESYYKIPPVYVQTLETVSVTADRLHQETDTLQEEQLQLFQELYVSGERVMIRLQVAENSYVHFIIGHENVKHWAALTAMNRWEESMEALTAFAKAYNRWLQHLSKGTSFDIAQSYLQYFNGETNADGSCKYHSVLPKILLQLQEASLPESEAMNVLQNRIKQKITNILDVNNSAHFAALVVQYNHPEYKTGYLDQKEQEGFLKQINGIQNRIKAKKATARDLTNKKRLEQQWKGAVQVEVRHKKMQMIYASISWILGRKGKFLSREAKKQFAKYCYLLDMQHWKEENRVLITDWLNVACTAKPNLKKNANDVVEIYQKKVKEALLQAHSFDDCFTQITQIALDKYQEELDKLTTYKRYENLIGLARKVNVSNPSNTKKSNTLESSTHKTRRAEVLAPFYKKEGDETHSYIHLPHDFFLIVPEARERLTQFKYLPETKQAFSDIYTHWKAIEENAEYQVYLADFKTVNASLRDAKMMNSLEEINRLKEQRDKIKHYYKDWYTDVVLSLLQSRLKEDDARLPSGWQKKEVGRIRKHKQLFFSKEIKGVTVLFTLKQLKNHDFYNGSGKKGALIDLMIARLQHEHPEKESYTYEELKTALQLHWKESIQFISALLQFEERCHRRLTTTEDVFAQKMAYISFEDFEKEIGNNFDKIKEARNYALHGDVLAPEDSYRALIHLLKRVKY